MIHDMSDLRARRQEATRHAIIEAYLDLSHRDGAAAVSIPAVAAEASVSVRTVYRYFATKDELQTAAAFHVGEVALGGDDIYENPVSHIAEHLRLLWKSFDAQLPAVIAEHSTPAGRELRSTRLTIARESTAAALPGSASQADVDMLIAVASSAMFLELVDRMGYSPEAAADMAVRVARLILVDFAGPDAAELL